MSMLSSSRSPLDPPSGLNLGAVPKWLCSLELSSRTSPEDRTRRIPSGASLVPAWVCAPRGGRPTLDRSRCFLCRQAVKAQAQAWLTLSACECSTSIYRFRVVMSYTYRDSLLGYEGVTDPLFCESVSRDVRE